MSEVGQEVIVYAGYYDIKYRNIQTINKVTKKQFHLKNSSKFNRDTLTKVGDGSVKLLIVDETIKGDLIEEETKELLLQEILYQVKHKELLEKQSFKALTIIADTLNIDYKSFKQRVLDSNRGIK